MPRSHVLREKNRRLAILGPKLHALLAEEESRAGASLFGFGPALRRKRFPWKKTDARNPCGPEEKWSSGADKRLLSARVEG
ncbi:hypothetical protein [Candidatus Methylacidithermus pantelleriae]|nr:hypothetical protein [Candidatus Methylacidithermus pantelleriae]